MTQPLPILFVHGFNGTAAGWEPLRQALVARGADPSLLWYFHYGWVEEEGAPPPAPPAPPKRRSLAERLGLPVRARRSEPVVEALRRYNNQGDIQQLAARLMFRASNDPDTLHSQLVRLSEASVAAGGPAKVTIVAHSMGGLIARYYLSRREPDEWGTVNEGVVGRLVTLATPHQGVELASLVHLVPPDAFIWTVLRWLEKLPFVRGTPVADLARLEAEVQALQARVLAEEMPLTAQGYLDSPAVAQMTPGSDFLAALNRPGAMPKEVEYLLLWGDVRFSAAVRWGLVNLWERAVTFGDLLVSAHSASTLNMPAGHVAFPWGRSVEVRVGDPAAAPTGISDFLPPVSHSSLLLNPDVHAAIARAVGL